MTRFAATLTIAIVTALTSRGEICDIDSLRNAMSRRQLTPIEGIWQWSDGATLAISRISPNECCIVMVDSPDLRISPGTIAGHASASPSANTWDISLASQVDAAGRMTKQHRFVARIDDKGALKLTPYKVGYKWNWWRLLPHYFRFRVESVNTRPSELDGGRRIFPPNLRNPYEPVVL